MFDIINHINLLYTIFLNHKKAFLACLEKAGADKEIFVNMPDQNGMTPLSLAVFMNRPEFVDILIYYGANYKEIDCNSNSLLVNAVYLGYIEIFDTLLAKDSAYLLPVQNFRGFTAMHIATLSPERYFLRKLVQIEMRELYKDNFDITDNVYTILDASLNGLRPTDDAIHIRKTSKVLQRIVKQYNTPASQCTSEDSDILDLSKHQIGSLYSDIAGDLIITEDELDLLNKYSSFIDRLDCLAYYFNQFTPVNNDCLGSTIYNEHQQIRYYSTLN